MFNQIVIFLILHSFIYLVQSFQNLLRQSDFQNYDFSYNSNNLQWYVFLPSNISTWFNYQMGYIQIKKRYDVETTTCADLASDVPYTLCQNIELIPGAKYLLSYTIFCESRINHMNVGSFVNNKLLSILFIQESNQFGMMEDYFIAQQTQNKICFNQTHLPLVPENVGGCIDNITLYRVEIYPISFQVILKEMESQIQLKSNLRVTGQVSEQFKDRYSIYGEGQELTDIQYVLSQQGYLSIKAKINKNIKVNTINFKENEVGNKQIIQFQISILDQGKYFYALQSAQKNFTTGIVVVSSFLAKIVGRTAAFFKTFIFSYILFNLVSFQILSLFYIFLNLSVFPQFVKAIYYQLLKIQFQYSSIINSIQRLFNIQKNPILIEPEEKEIQEILEKQKEGNMWFGQLGVTTLFWSNNGENILVLLVTFFKLGLLKCIERNIDWKISKQITKLDLGKIMLLQFFLMVPTLIIPSIYQILSPTKKLIHLFEKSLHLIATFFILFLLSIYFVVVKRKSRRNGNTLEMQINIKESCNLKQQSIKVQEVLKHTIKRTDKTCKQLKTQTKIQPLLIQQPLGRIIQLQFVQNLFIITNPTSLLLGPVPFFLINSPVLLCKFILVIQDIKSGRICGKIATYLIVIVQMVHHLAFFALFIINQKRKKQQGQDIQYNDSVISLSLVIITTIVVGTIINLVNFLLEVVCAVGCLIKVGLRCISNNKIQVQQLIEEKQKKKKEKQNKILVVREQTEINKQRYQIQKMTCITQKNMKQQQKRAKTKVKKTKNY